MANKPSTGHDWINTVVAAVALVVSGVSAFFAYQANHISQQAEDRKAESVVFPEVHPTGECNSAVGGATVGLCWSAVISNASEDRLTIIGFDWRDIGSVGAISGGPFQVFDADGRLMAFPISIDGGDARKVILRFTVLTSSPVANALNDMQDHPPVPQLLGDIERELARKGLDVLGNMVSPRMSGDRVIGWSREPPIRTINRLVTAKTGRKNSFPFVVTYPADLTEFPD